MGLFSRWKAARRARAVERNPISDELWDWALKEHRILRSLDTDEADRLRTLATIFLNEKEFHPVQGAELDDELAVSIAAQACLPILELGVDWYDGWTTVIVTPDAYGITREEIDEAGVVHEYDDELAGEVMHLGPVVLSIPDIDASGWGDGYNVVIHEMAHKIDGRSGTFDGAPPLPPSMNGEEWRSVFSSAFGTLRNQGGPRDKKAPNGGRRRGSSGHGKKGGRQRIRIDPYGAFSPDEFFAVCTEWFFEKPVVLRSDLPEVYRLLTAFYRQDPYGRLAGI